MLRTANQNSLIYDTWHSYIMFWWITNSICCWSQCRPLVTNWHYSFYCTWASTMVRKVFLSLEYAMHLCTTLSLFYFWLRAGLAFGIKVTFQILKAPSVALIHAWMNLSLDFLLLYRITEIIKQGSLIVFTMSSFSLNFQIRALLQKTLFQCILWRIILLRINEGWPGVRQILLDYVCLMQLKRWPLKWKLQ